MHLCVINTMSVDNISVCFLLQHWSKMEGSVKLLFMLSFCFYSTCEITADIGGTWRCTTKDCLQKGNA